MTIYHTIMEVFNILYNKSSEQINNKYSHHDRHSLRKNTNNFLDFNWANLLLILWGKSGIIKFEFKPTKVSPCSSQCLPCQLYWYLHASIYILSLSTCCRSQWEQGMEYTYTIRKPWFYQQNIYISRLDVYT